ncbi:MAG TPA: hypothetical protein VEX86_16905 [Longimicrobium sp.]|nr:hypothetical protein [Longimicrobium sp.]
MKARLFRIAVLTPLAIMAAAQACGDRTPTASAPAPLPAARALTRLECTVRMDARTLACTGAGGAGAARGNLIVGSPFVALSTTDVGYDSAASILSANVRLQNLMPQPMGTADGVNADSAGTTVFFHTGPTVSAGAGEVSVANPDLIDVFTASGQPAFRYAGIIAPTATSAPRLWRFDVPLTVQSFVFTLLVSTRLPNEAGRIDISPTNPVVAPGATRSLTATSYTATGTQRSETVA